MTVKIIIADLSDPRSFVCKRARVWARRHGIDWEAFKRDGIDVSELYATGDHLDMIRKIENTARRRLGMEEIHG